MIDDLIWNVYYLDEGNVWYNAGQYFNYRSRINP